MVACEFGMREKLRSASTFMHLFKAIEVANWQWRVAMNFLWDKMTQLWNMLVASVPR